MRGDPDRRRTLVTATRVARGPSRARRSHGWRRRGRRARVVTGRAHAATVKVGLADGRASAGERQRGATQINGREFPSLLFGPPRAGGLPRASGFAPCSFRPATIPAAKRQTLTFEPARAKSGGATACFENCRSTREGHGASSWAARPCWPTSNIISNNRGLSARKSPHGHSSSARSPGIVGVARKASRREPREGGGRARHSCRGFDQQSATPDAPSGFRSAAAGLAREKIAKTKRPDHGHGSGLAPEGG